MQEGQPLSTAGYQAVSDLRQEVQEKTFRRRRSCGKKMLDDCLFPYEECTAMVETRSEYQHTAYMLLHDDLCYK